MRMQPSVMSTSTTLFFLSVLHIVFAQYAPGTPCSTTDCDSLLSIGGPTPGLQCFVDPTDPADFATLPGVCPCAPNQVPLDGHLVFTGLNNVVTTARPVNTQSYTTSLVWEYPMQSYNVPLTSILPDSLVTVYYELGPFGTVSFSYTQTQSQSIFYTAITSTVVSTIDSQTTTTQTATEIDISILPVSTTTSRCTTAVQTFTAKPVTITITVTSTPVPRTIHKNIISTTTTTLTCIPGPTKAAAPKARRSPRENLLNKRQQLEIEFEVPRCADTPASTIEIVTFTTLSVSYTTKVDTSTSFTTLTQTTTSQLPVATVCSNIKGSTTITPTKTKTKTIHLNKSTISSINSVTITKTVVPKHLGVCSTPGAGVSYAMVVNQPAVTLAGIS